MLYSIVGYFSSWVVANHTAACVVCVALVTVSAAFGIAMTYRVLTTDNPNLHY